MPRTGRTGATRSPKAIESDQRTVRATRGIESDGETIYEINAIYRRDAPKYIDVRAQIYRRARPNIYRRAPVAI